MVAAYVLITIRRADPLKVLVGLRGVAGVQHAHVLLGPTDAIAYIERSTHEELHETILDLRSVEGVETTDTRYVYT